MGSSNPGGGPMTAFGKPYHPSGRFGMLDACSVLAGGLLAAISSAAIVHAWEASPLPMLVVGGAVLQGLLLAAVLRGLVRWSRLRNPAVAGFIGVVCGAAGVFAVHEARFVHFVLDQRRHIRQEWDGYESAMTPAQVLLYEQAVAHPFRVVNDGLLIPETGRRGLLGYLLWQAKSGQALSRGHVLKGKWLWAVWAGEGAFVAWAVSLTAERAARARSANPAGRGSATPGRRWPFPPTTPAHSPTRPRRGTPRG